MSAKHKFIYDETKFRPGQRKAGLLLAEYEFSPKEIRKDKEEIAEECGISRMTLYRWERQDPNFIKYKNYLVSEMMDSHLGAVYKRLLDVIMDDGNTKGMEMFLKRIGDLDSKQDVTIRQGEDEMSAEERKKELLDRLGLQEKGEEGDAEEGKDE